ncbi:MAG TPA: hypothetical protein VNC84_02520 [Gammaproteobacteria bacterium]|jgi:predicted transcriptional regulator of viral defense system|nr:hypothetical protein [Gammaproteobacteria bacterium]
MTTLKDKLTEAGLTDRIITDVDLSNLLDGTQASRYALINKALSKREIIRLRRGLYLLAEKYRHQKLSQLFLATRIAPNSYISMESALSYHGWIPEKVTTVTNVLAIGRTKKFTTPFGEFIFYRLPINEYEFLTGVTRVEEIKNQPFLLACPLRALCDYVYLRKIDWQGIDYLTKGLRIDMENLMKLKSADFDETKNVYQSKRTLRFLDNLKKELKKQ